MFRLKKKIVDQSAVKEDISYNHGGMLFVMFLKIAACKQYATAMSIFYRAIQKHRGLMLQYSAEQ